MPGLKERAKTLVELIDSAAYLFVSTSPHHLRKKLKKSSAMVVMRS